MLKPNQQAALKKLEAALLSVKRSGLVLVGCDDALLATVNDDALAEAAQRDSSVEAVLARINYEVDTAWSVKHYGSYRDSGAT